jgi:hypothetical protein
VSDADNPAALKMTVAPLVALVGESVNIAAAPVTVNIACAESPWLPFT